MSPNRLKRRVKTLPQLSMAGGNLASFGARWPRSCPPLQKYGSNTNVGPRTTGTLMPPPTQWYYQPNPAVASQYVQRHQTAVPYYGYGPATYVATNGGSYDHDIEPGSFTMVNIIAAVAEEMAKSKNHTAHNQSTKAHKNDAAELKE